MKKLIAVSMIICAIETAAVADSFLDDYNLYAQSLYGLNQIESTYSDQTMSAYRSDHIEIMKEDQSVTIYGSDDHEVITAACCAMRVIDNQGSMIDQYGRILNAYFLCRANGRESRATTESNVLIFIEKENGIMSIRMVK